ncbi:MAG: hypothetical protein HY394_04470 [Candidatus Diapherotrites archaeon]|nr:hypothetical protein [Candidatus Diapherotrites archaeon]
MAAKKFFCRAFFYCLFVIFILLSADFAFATVEGDTQGSSPNTVKNVKGWIRNYSGRNWTVGIIGTIVLALVLWWALPAASVTAAGAGAAAKTAAGGALGFAGRAIAGTARWFWAPIRLLWKAKLIPVGVKLAGITAVGGVYAFFAYLGLRAVGATGSTPAPVLHTKDYLVLCPGVSGGGTSVVGISSIYRIHTQKGTLNIPRQGASGSATIVVTEARQSDGRSWKDDATLLPETPGSNKINFTIVSRGSLGNVNIKADESHVLKFKSRYNGIVTLDLYLSRGKAGRISFDDLEIDPKTSFLGQWPCGEVSPEAAAEAKKILDEMKEAEKNNGGTTPAPAPAPPGGGTAPAPSGGSSTTPPAGGAATRHPSVPANFLIYLPVPEPQGRTIVEPVAVFKKQGESLVNFSSLTERLLDTAGGVYRQRDKKVTSIFWRYYLAEMSTGVFSVATTFDDGSGYACSFECFSSGNERGGCNPVGDCLPSPKPGTAK